MIGTLVLAAGGATRFGSPKLLAEWWGRPLVEWALRAAPTDTPRIAVVGRDTLKLRPLFAYYGFAVVRNPRPSSGLASSLRIGLGRMPREIEAALVLLGDAPDTPPAVIDRVRTAFDRENRAVAAAYDGVRGHPAILPRRDWEHLPKTGDRAGATLDVVLVECGDLATQGADVDTPDDLFTVAANRSGAPLVNAADGLEMIETRLAVDEPFVVRSVDRATPAPGSDHPTLPITTLRDQALAHGRMIQLIARVEDQYAALVG
jgi:CTP:molybdopterin cytidylyltransferase MocA